mgnify:CR=1 FL=1
MIIFYIIWIALMIWWCHSIAKKNGRNTAWASIMGFLFGILAVIIYLALGETEAVKEKRILKIMAKKDIENIMESAMKLASEKMKEDTKQVKKIKKN